MTVSRVWMALLPLACLIAGTGASAQQCPPNAHYTQTTRSGNVETKHCACDAGFQKRDGACRRIGGDPRCIKRAGERLNAELQQGCAGTVGRCFEGRKVSLSAAAVACVIGCRHVGAVPSLAASPDWRPNAISKPASTFTMTATRLHWQCTRQPCLRARAADGVAALVTFADRRPAGCGAFAGAANRFGH